MSVDRLRAIVVGTVNYGESDRIARLLSPTHGRVSVIARKARASKRRFGGALEPGNEITAHLPPRRRAGSLWSLRGLDVVRMPNRARQDLARLALLAYGCEVCAALAPEHHEAKKLYRLLQVWLELLDEPGTLGVASRIALEAKALTFAGLAPALVRCASCGEPASEPMVFQVTGGGAVHGRCGGGGAVGTDMLQRMETLRRTPLADTVGDEAPVHPAGLLADFIEAQLGKGLRSRSFAEEWSR